MQDRPPPLPADFFEQEKPPPLPADFFASKPDPVRRIAQGKPKSQVKKESSVIGALAGLIGAGGGPKIQAENQIRAANLAKFTGKTVAPATTVSGVPNPKPKAASGMDLANMANELQNRLSKKLAPLNIPGMVSPMSPQNLVGLKPSDIAAGAIAGPIDIAGDVAVFGDRNSTREQQLGALANIVIKTPLAVTGGGLVLKGASKGLQLAFDAARQAKNAKALTQVLKQAEKQGVDIETLTKGFKTEPTQPVIPKTQPTPSGVSAKAKREVKPVVKPVEEDLPVVYHGSSSEFAEFDPGRLGSKTGATSAKEGFFFTDKEDIAKGYADLGNTTSVDALEAKANRLERIAQKSGKNEDWQAYSDAYAAYEDAALGEANKTGRSVKKAKLQLQNPLIVEAGGKAFSEAEGAALIKRAKASGHDGVILRDVADAVNTPFGAAGERPLSERSTVYVVFDRKQILDADTPPTPPKATPKPIEQPTPQTAPTLKHGDKLTDGDSISPESLKDGQLFTHKPGGYLMTATGKVKKTPDGSYLVDYRTSDGGFGTVSVGKGNSVAVPKSAPTPPKATPESSKGAKEAESLQEQGRKARAEKSLNETLVRTEDGRTLTLREHADDLLARGYKPEMVTQPKYTSKAWEKKVEALQEEKRRIIQREFNASAEQFHAGKRRVQEIEAQLSEGMPRETVPRATGSDGGSYVISKAQYDYMTGVQSEGAWASGKGWSPDSGRGSPSDLPAPEPPKTTPKPLEPIGGPPREIPLSKPTGEIPKPKKVAEAPKVEGPEPSGLSRSSRAVLADVYGTNKPTSIGGKSLDDLYESGRKKLNEGFDAEAEMDALAKAARPATDEEIGAFSVYRDDLIGQLDLLERKLKGGSDDVVSERLDLLEKVAAFDRNLDEVKGAGGRSLNAFKIGHKVAWDNLNEVLIEAKRYKPVSAGREAQFRDLTGKQAEQAERITRLEQELAEVKATGVAQTTSRGKATVERARMERAEVFKELDELLKSSAGKTHDIGSAAYDALRASKIAGRIAITYLKEGVGTLDEAVSKVVADFAERGIKVSAQDIYDDIDNMTVTRTRSEIQQQAAKLRQEAKNLSSRARAAKEASEKAKYEKQLTDTQKKAADLQKQLETGEYRVPTKREKVITKELEDARAERSLYAAKVQAALRAHAAPMSKKIAKETAGLIRGTILGSDIGTLTRQGLFGLSRPGAFVKGVGKGLKAAMSEKNLVKIESDILSHKVGGQTAGVVYRKAGLSWSSHLTNPEELFVGKLLSKIPGVGTLGRFQTAFINTVRSETMDRAIRLGYRENELAARANFINSATGRSNIKNVPTYLEVIMTSPRYEASRWEMIAQPFRNPALILKDAATGKGLNRGAVANIQDMAITAAEIYGLYKIAETSGYEVEFDPTSSDFLKMRKGDEVWDVSAGLAPRLRDTMRLLAWSLKPGYHENALKVLGQSVVRPISPAVRQPAEVASQAAQRKLGVPEDKLASLFTGWKIDEDEKGWITFAPLIIQTAKKYLDEGDSKGAASAAFREWIGQSVNRYSKPAK